MSAAEILDWSASAPYVIGSWVVGVGALGGYTWSVLRRGRRLSREVPPDRRRWM